MKNTESNDMVKEHNEEPLSLWEVACSVLAAAFGVQSKANKKRDFTRGKPGQFIAIGLIFTVIFLFAVFGLVQLVLSAAH